MAIQKILTIAEVADLLQVHPITVYRLIKQRKLPAFRIGRVLRFDADQLEDWIGANRRKVVAKDDGRRREARSSAEYVAYRRGETFPPQRSLETLAINRPVLVRSFVAAREIGRKHLLCERCRGPGKPITALLLFGASKRMQPACEKLPMPLCRSCFGELRKICSKGSLADASGRRALAAASKTARRESRTMAVAPAR
jgi:excisionase family DNA binding protein